MKRIISLSSIPPRFPFLKPTLQSLLAQDTVSEVRLYIPKTYRRFKAYAGVLPDVPEGIKICIEQEDMGPATKILPATRDYRGQDVQILFCDDDQVFPTGWAKRLFDEQAKRPDEAVATLGRIYAFPRANPQMKMPHARQQLHKNDLRYRAGRLKSKIFNVKEPLWRPIVKAGYIEILFGAGGVVVKPDFFDDEAFNIPEIAWPVDDIWLSAQLARRGVAIYSPRRFPCPSAADHSNCDALMDDVFSGKKRQDSNRLAINTCLEMFGIWK